MIRLRKEMVVDETANLGRESEEVWLNGGRDT